MKHLNCPFFHLSIFLFTAVFVQAKDHKPKLNEIGNRIKQAVKSGKISKEEGWEKWRTVQQQHGHHEKVEYKHDAEDWDDIDDLEHEIEIRSMEFELERIEQEHEFERLKWEHQMERMQHDFDRERKEWAIHDMHLHTRMELMKKEIGNHLRSGTEPLHGISSRHPRDRRADHEIHRSENQRRMPPHLQHNNKQTTPKSKRQINSNRQPGLKSGCKKNDSACNKDSRKEKKSTSKDKGKEKCSAKKGK
jgi:hypothetical protein